MVFKILKRLIYILFFPFLFILNKVFPLNEEKVLFCTKAGQFNGNAKHFFIYLLEKKTKYPIWVAEDIVNYDYLCNKFGQSNIFLSKKGFFGTIKHLYHYVSAATIIIRGQSDIWKFMRLGRRKKRKIINVGHGGSGPGMKRGGNGWINISAKKIKKGQKMRRAISHYITSSELQRYIIATSAPMDVKKTYPTGMPRNDIYFNNPPDVQVLKQNIKLLVKTNIDIEKIILYAPTHRDGDPTILFPFEDFSISRLQNILINNNAIMLLRTHDEENKFSIEDTKNIGKYLTDRIFYFSHTILLDINEILPCIDLLLTDYSSLVTDYLLFNKPIIYIPYDLLNYERGVHFSDYENWTPGIKVYSSEKFYNAIEQSLSDPFKYSLEREKLKTMLHKHIDGNSCERLLDLINS